MPRSGSTRRPGLAVGRVLLFRPAWMPGLKDKTRPTGSDSGEKAPNQAHIRVLLECRCQSFVPEPFTNAVHHSEGPFVGVSRVVDAPRILKQLAERQFGLPVLNRIPQRGGEVSRFPEVPFSRVPVVVGARNFPGKTPRFHQVLAR